MIEQRPGEVRPPGPRDRSRRSSEVTEEEASQVAIADSQPALEYQETINKAKGMLRAIEIAEKSFD